VTYFCTLLACLYFSWLDKLGLTAQAGFRHVFRQTFIGGNVPPFALHYALVGSDLTPNPDYFSSVLHRRLMGPTVLDVTQSQGGKKDDLARIYAHCTVSQSSDSLPPQYVKPGSVSLMVLSLHRDMPLTISFHSDMPGTGRLDFILSSNSTTGKWEEAMVSSYMNLNGVTLLLDSEGNVPSMPPKISIADQPSSITFEPLTYGFIVLYDAQAKACGYQGEDASDVGDFGQVKVALA
jgi:heparanase 1